MGIWEKVKTEALEILVVGRDALKFTFFSVPQFIFVGIPNAVIPVLRFKVCRWHTACGGFKADEMRFLVCCTEDVWYWALAEWFWLNVESWVCYLMDDLPLPGFLLHWKRAWDGDEPICTFEECYGDTFGGLWHFYVCNPPFQFIWKHLDKHHVEFFMTLDEAKVRFSHHPKHYEWAEGELKRHREWEAEEEAEKAKEKEG